MGETGGFEGNGRNRKWRRNEEETWDGEHGREMGEIGEMGEEWEGFGKLKGMEEYLGKWGD